MRYRSQNWYIFHEHIEATIKKHTLFPLFIFNNGIIVLKDPYIAHLRKSDGQIQSVQAHLKETAVLAKVFAQKLNLESAGELLGLMHDFGKYSRKFQNISTMKRVCLIPIWMMRKVRLTAVKWIIPPLVRNGFTENWESLVQHRASANFSDKCRVYALPHTRRRLNWLLFPV